MAGLLVGGARGGGKRAWHRWKNTLIVPAVARPRSSAPEDLRLWPPAGLGRLVWYPAGVNHRQWNPETKRNATHVVIRELKTETSDILR